jgi:hypothetical protein
MADVDRATLRRKVYERLVDPEFRGRLTATAPDGTQPITVALREDHVGALLAEVSALGGAANVVVPALGGFVVLAMTQSHGATGVRRRTKALTPDCTVGVLVERVKIDDGNATYRFVVEGPVEQETGSAELVAIGG